MTKPRFKPGEPIYDVLEVIRLLREGQWFYWPSDGRPKSPKILLNMNVNVLDNAARFGRLRPAIKRTGEIS